MGSSVGRFIRGLFGFGKPLPTSQALMVGAVADDPHEHRLRRAMHAASVPEEVALDQPVIEPLQDVVVDDVALAAVVSEDDEVVIELAETPAIAVEASPMAIDLEVALAEASIEAGEPDVEVEIPAVVADEIEAAIDEPPIDEEPVAALEIHASVPDMPETAVDVPPVESEEIAAAADVVAEAPYELTEVLPEMLEPAPAELAAREAETPAKKAPKKKAAAKKASKKRAAPRKRKDADATPADDADDDAAPVEGSASFEGTVEASAP